MAKPHRSFRRSLVGVVATSALAITAAGIVDADWDQEYDSTNDVDSSGFLDIAATTEGGAFILGYHSGVFESLDAGLQYQPFVQYRNPAGDVEWTERIVIAETCTAVTPVSSGRGMSQSGDASFGVRTCSGSHLVIADTAGIVSTRSFPVPEPDPEDSLEFADTFLISASDPTGGMHIVTSESRVVDGGSDALYLTELDRNLAVTSMTALPVDLFPIPPDGFGPGSLDVDSAGVSLLVATTKPPLAHLEGEDALVRITPGGAETTRTALGAAECGRTRVVRSTDEIWIVQCSETREPNDFGNTERYRLEVRDLANPATVIESTEIALNEYSDDLRSALVFGESRFSTDGTLLGNPFSDTFLRVDGRDPNLWTTARLGGDVDEPTRRGKTAFDAIGNDVVEVGTTSEDQFDFIDFAVGQLVDAPQAFIERTPLPSLVAAPSARYVDTRPSGETIDGEAVGSGRVGARSVTEFQLAGRGAVPDGAIAVFANVTAVNPSANGFATAFPCGAQRPDASSLNYRGGVTSGNHTLATLDNDGKLCVYSSAATDLVIDIGGLYGAGDELGALTPARLLDTRRSGATVDDQALGGGARNANVEIVVPVHGRAGVPADATEVVVNLSTIASRSVGFAVIYPCGGVVPGVSAINFGPGAVSNNLAIVEVGTDGAICIQTSTPTEMTADVTGWLGERSALGTDDQFRALETRAFIGQELPPDFPDEDRDCCRIDPDNVQFFSLGNRRDGGPVDAAFVNVTAIAPVASGFVSVFPCDFDREDLGRTATSVLNFSTGVTSGNTALIGGGGTFENSDMCVYASASTHLVIDVLARS